MPVSNYGTQYTESASAAPGAREYAQLTVAKDNHALWLFGGYGSIGAGQGLLNDLWRFNILTGNWSWWSGGALGGTPQSGYIGIEVSPTTFETDSMTPLLRILSFVECNKFTSRCFLPCCLL